MNKQEMFARIDQMKDELFAAACDIFDHPECDGKEYYASDLLIRFLTDRGFAVEKGVGGLETSFRAVWKHGEGGPNIGFLGEYDALRDVGHVCGHHLQTPAAIGALMALKEVFENTDTPCTITLYGTPAEETFGGKIVMLENGCFRELDAAISTHAGGDCGRLSGSSMALTSLDVTYHGISSHAAGTPYDGRSAADAMLLSFNGFEFMREHVKDGTRMHYTILESTGPSNVVPARAKARYTLRSRDNNYLPELDRRFRNIVQGACLMTETTADIEKRPTFAANRPNDVLKEIALRNLHEMNLPKIIEEYSHSGGSTDFGNVACAVPGILIYLPYCMGGGHSKEWYDEGKTEAAVGCLMNSAKALAGIGYDLIQNPELVRRVKEEFCGA